jgi:hypothetical protein
VELWEKLDKFQNYLPSNNPNLPIKQNPPIFPVLLPLKQLTKVQVAVLKFLGYTGTLEQ